MWFPRRMGWILDRPALACRGAHRVRENGRIIEDGGLRCEHQERPGAAECGHHLWVYSTRARGDKRTLWGADITYNELLEFERRGMTVDAIITYLGANL